MSKTFAQYSSRPAAAAGSLEAPGGRTGLRLGLWDMLLPARLARYTSQLTWISGRIIEKLKANISEPKAAKKGLHKERETMVAEAPAGQGGTSEAAEACMQWLPVLTIENAEQLVAGGQARNARHAAVRVACSTAVQLAFSKLMHSAGRRFGRASVRVV